MFSVKRSTHRPHGFIALQHSQNYCVSSWQSLRLCYQIANALDNKKQLPKRLFNILCSGSHPRWNQSHTDRDGLEKTTHLAGRMRVMSRVIPLCNPVFERNSRDKQRHTNRGWILKVLPSNSLLKSLTAVWLGCILTDGDTGRQSYLFTAAQKPDVKEVVMAWWRSLSVCLE